MRKIVVQAFQTMDGVVQAPGQPEEDRDGAFAFGGWAFPYWDGVMGEVMDEHMREPSDLLLGRRTYDIFAAHWPKAPKDDPMARMLNEGTKYVATHRPESLAWGPYEALGHDVAGRLRDIKGGDGPRLVVHGSGELVQTLLAEDLADEFNVWTFPLVLGGGKRLFRHGAKPAGLDLVDVRTSTTGVIIARYRSAPMREPGSFALDARGAG